MTAETAVKRSTRPKLADISLDRDLYLEVCEAQGIVPLPVIADPAPVDWNVVIFPDFAVARFLP